MELHFSIATKTAKDAIDDYIRQYGFGRYKLADGSDAGEKAKALRDLKKPTKAQVDKIIGSDGWTNFWCHGCHDYKPEVAVFDIGDYTAEVCEDCLRAALKMFKPR